VAIPTSSTLILWPAKQVVNGNAGGNGQSNTLNMSYAA
jgi:hypothetical protein